MPPRAFHLFAALAAVALLAACAPASIGTPVEPVDPTQSVIFHNGAVLTMEASQPVAQAIALRGDKIEAVGDDDSVLALREPGSLVIDLAGRALLPGFVDAHTHVLNDARSLGMSLDQAQALALRSGITTLGDLYVDRSFLQEMQAFATSSYLRVRTSLYLVHTDPCGNDQGDWWQAHPPTRVPGEMLRLGGVKIFTDGGSCGNVALSFDHADQHGGDLWHTQDELNRMVAEVQAAGHQAAIHAIGDRAVGQAQAAVAAALNGQPNTYRHRLEHVSVMTPEMVGRFGELGLVPVLPGQYPACTPFGPPLPAAYGHWEWPWRDLRDRNPGLNIAWHSDYPFWSINPFIHLYGFVTRRDVYSGYRTCDPQPWLRDDTLAVSEALSIMTLQSAYALFRETEVGSLAPGKYADLIVISANPLAVDAEELRSLSVLATLVGGRVEYCAPSAADLCPGYTARAVAPLPDYRPPVPVRWAALIGLLGLPLAAATVRLWLGAPRSWLARLGGLAGILGGLIWIVVWPLTNGEASDRWSFLYLIATAVLAVGVVGLAALGRPGWLGWAGLAGAFAGSLALGSAFGQSWFEWEGGWFLLILGLLAHTVGLALFGLANLKARLLPRFNFLPLIVGLISGPLPLFVVFLLAPNADWPLVFLVGGLGLGWMALGTLTFLTARRPAPEAAPT